MSTSRYERDTMMMMEMQKQIMVLTKQVAAIHATTMNMHAMMAKQANNTSSNMNSNMDSNGNSNRNSMAEGQQGDADLLVKGAGRISVGESKAGELGRVDRAAAAAVVAGGGGGGMLPPLQLKAPASGAAGQESAISRRGSVNLRR